MGASPKKDQLDIPDFLDVKNANENVKVPKVENVAPRTEPTQAELEDAALKALPLEIRQRIEKAIAEHKFQRHWVIDYNTVRQFIDQIDTKKNKEADGLHKLNSKPKPERKPKALFGVGVKVEVLQAAPRAEGTGAAKRYAEMAAYMKKNPHADLASMMKDTPYRRDDFMWDIARGNIKTDPVTFVPDKAIPKKQFNAARKAAKAATSPAPQLPPAGKETGWSGKNKKKAKPAPAPQETSPKADMRKAVGKAIRKYKKNGGKVTKGKTRNRSK